MNPTCCKKRMRFRRGRFVCLKCGKKERFGESMICPRCGNTWNVRYKQKRPYSRLTRAQRNKRKHGRQGMGNVAKKTWKRTDFTVICSRCGEFDERVDSA